MSKMTFETAIKRLEEIAASLENSDLGLDESLKAFEEGMELARFCGIKLSESENKLKALVKKGEGFQLDLLET